MPEDKLTIYEQAGLLENPVGFGNTPVLLVVDLHKAFTSPEHPFGSDLPEVIDRTNQLITAAHASGVPVVLTRIVTKHPDGADLGVWVKKAPDLRSLQSDSEWVELDPRLERSENDHVLDKRQASAFHETELNSMLTAWGADTVIVTGCSTSGCIRATVVDACSSGYRTIVPEGCVGDRAPEPHEANLFDMGTKYADVLSHEEVVDYLATIG